MLKNRQKLIVLNLKQAKTRTIEVEQKLKRAQQTLQNISLQIVDIKNQTKIEIEKYNRRSQIQLEAEIQRLQENKMMIISYQRKQMQKQIYDTILDSVFQTVYEKFEKGLNPEIHKLLNEFYINSLKNLSS